MQPSAQALGRTREEWGAPSRLFSINESNGRCEIDHRIWKAKRSPM